MKSCLYFCQSVCCRGLMAGNVRVCRQERDRGRTELRMRGILGQSWGERSVPGLYIILPCPSQSSSVLLSHLKQEERMGAAALKSCCLYLCLIFLSGIILLTSFTIQWILYSIQFSLVSLLTSLNKSQLYLLDRKELALSVWLKVDWRYQDKPISLTLCMPTGTRWRE